MSIKNCNSLDLIKCKFISNSLVKTHVEDLAMDKKMEYIKLKILCLVLAHIIIQYKNLHRKVYHLSLHFQNQKDNFM